MVNIEDDKSIRAPWYSINWSYKENKEENEYKFSFDEGFLQCSGPSKMSSMCTLNRDKINKLKKSKWENTFLFMDVGKWGHEKGKKEEYSFGLISGPHVYLCEYIPNQPTTPESNNEYVKAFFNELKKKGDGVKVINYGKANYVRHKTLSDSHLYLLLPDFHLPPLSFFIPKEIALVDSTGATSPQIKYLNKYDGKSYDIDIIDIPDWIRSGNIFKELTGTEKEYYKVAYSILKQVYLDEKADIFGDAGTNLIRFINALKGMPDEIKQTIHLVNVGDMLELWMNREYLFEPSDDPTEKPKFISGGKKKAKGYILEVLLRNDEIFEAFRNLKGSGLAEIKYCWGNHDGYLMFGDVDKDCTLEPRDPSYTGLNGDLRAEHGHRFHSANFDNTTWYKGPLITNAVYLFPKLRDAEPLAEKYITGNATEIYLRGYSILFLYHKLSKFPDVKPFRILIIGHTHERKMKKCGIFLHPKK